MSHPSCKCHKVHICAWYVLSLSTLIIFSFSLKWYSVVKKTTVQLILFTKKATSINYSNSNFFKQPYCYCLALSHSTYKYSCEEVRRNPLLMPCFIVIRALLTSRCPIVISLSVRPCVHVSIFLVWTVTFLYSRYLNHTVWMYVGWQESVSHTIVAKLKRYVLILHTPC